jgi:hypothetical protein
MILRPFLGGQIGTFTNNFSLLRGSDPAEQDEKILVLVLMVGHRSTVYDKA